MEDIRLLAQNALQQMALMCVSRVWKMNADGKGSLTGTPRLVEYQDLRHHDAVVVKFDGWAQEEDAPIYMSFSLVSCHGSRRHIDSLIRASLGASSWLD